MTYKSIQIMHDLAYGEFIESVLPLYHASMVKIKVGTATYEVSKALLCKDSPYFTAMFNGAFKEGEEQSVALEEIEGVVSVRGFQLLLQWLYLGRIIFDKEDPEDKISAIVELARFADMLGVSNMESPLAETIRTIILKGSEDLQWEYGSNANVHYINSQHIDAATRLPIGHKLRLIFAQAAVESFVNSNDFKFSDDVREKTDFAADILQELMSTLATYKHIQYTSEVTDPFSGKRITLRSRS